MTTTSMRSGNKITAMMIHVHAQHELSEPFERVFLGEREGGKAKRVPRESVVFQNLAGSHASLGGYEKSSGADVSGCRSPTVGGAHASMSALQPGWAIVPVETAAPFSAQSTVPSPCAASNARAARLPGR